MQHSLNMYQKMQENNILPSRHTLMALLKACARLENVERGREIHAEIVQKGFERDLFVGSTLVNMYTKCCSLAQAQEVFDKLPVRSAVTWNTLIAGYVEDGSGQEALKYFEQMQLEGLSPDAVTFLCILKACGSIQAIDKGREIHKEIEKKGFARDFFVGNTLLNMYAKWGLLSEAREIFNKLPGRTVEWNTLIAGYAEHGDGQEALKCFEEMQLEGIAPNAVTYICILKGCGNMRAISKGREIHVDIAQKGFEREAFVCNTLVDMYAACGSLPEAQEVFNKLPVQDIVSWNALIAGYAEHGPVEKALKCLEEMQAELIFPDADTFVRVLKACGSLGAINKGRELHAEITQKGYERDLFVGNTLVDMYAKCGSLLEAREVFDKLSLQDVVSWNALIKGYGMNHKGNMAVQCFEDMQAQGVKPNATTFTCLLIACSHTNQVLKGQEYFKVMKENYAISPTSDHCTCMVDLLARSGCLYEAEKFLELMECPPSEETWTAMLSACKTYGKPELGLRCFQQLVKMYPEFAASYVLMANIYSSAGMWDDAYKIEEQRKHADGKKTAATALIEVDKKVHEFVVGYNQSNEVSLILETLRSRMKWVGHVPNTDLVLRTIPHG